LIFNLDGEELQRLAAGIFSRAAIVAWRLLRTARTGFDDVSSMGVAVSSGRQEGD